ncbi:hypothetical protein KIN20_016219, partial [Parelaphostrongylus tenuis]
MDSLDVDTPSLIQEGFPSRPSSANGLAIETTPDPMLTSAATTTFDAPTRFAIIQLTASVLHLDIWDDTDPNT